MKPLGALLNPRYKKIYTALLILSVIVVVFTLAIGLAEYTGVIVTNPPAPIQSYDYLKLSTSSSETDLQPVYGFSKDQDIYVHFDLFYVDANTPFESKWYYESNIFGKRVYFLIAVRTYTSKAGDQTVFFKIKNPGIAGDYRVDIYMYHNLVGTQHFWIQPSTR